MSISPNALKGKIATKAAAFPNKKLAAKSFGISPQHLDDIMTGRRDISDNFARKFGYRKSDTSFTKLSPHGQHELA